MEKKIDNELIGKSNMLSKMVEYQDSAVISRTIIKKVTGTVTLFAFDRGQELSEHSAPFDAMVMILDGKGDILINGEAHSLSSGESIIMPANIPHAVKATDKFKMILIMIK
jgi:quercetin dioxygenase-like cupin family protein